jgi:hypothetical protein
MLKNRSVIAVEGAFTRILRGLEFGTCSFLNLPARDEKLRVAAARRADRVYRMDAGWSPETFEVCRAVGR